MIWSLICFTTGVLFADKFPWIRSLKKLFPKFTRIVKFPDGKYAIRWKVGFYCVYKDLYNSSYWWCSKSRHFSDCLSTLEECKQHLKNQSLYSYGEPVE